MRFIVYLFAAIGVVAIAFILAGIAQVVWEDHWFPTRRWP